ncbi:MAG: hypothetical protein JNM39_15355 [Bdellovibrionaceae bacterium]|nr:hypothetical protein [Pseudobdellovibrionaceae bacterium]
MKRMTPRFLLVFAFLVTLSCGKATDRDTLGDAQICLDNVTIANPDAADACVEKVSAITTKAGDSIRCAGAFVKEGFTDASSLVATFSAVSSGSGSSAFLGSLVFDGRNSTNLTTTAGAESYYTQAMKASTYCASAGLKVGTLLTTFSFLGNAMINLACKATATCGVGIFSTTNPLDAVNLVSYLTNTSNSSAISQIYTDIGTLVINSYLISCVGTVVNATLCENVTTAVTTGGGTSAPAGVGKAFLKTVFSSTLSTLP